MVTDYCTALLHGNDLRIGFRENSAARAQVIHDYQVAALTRIGDN